MTVILCVLTSRTLVKPSWRPATVTAWRPVERCRDKWSSASWEQTLCWSWFDWALLYSSKTRRWTGDYAAALPYQEPTNHNASSVKEPGVWKWGYTNNRTYRRPFTSAVYSRVWRELRRISIPPEKNEFGVVEDAISSCLEGLTCTLQSLLSRSPNTFSIPPHPPPSLFLCKFGQIFNKWGSAPRRIRTSRPLGSASAPLCYQHSV